MESPAQSVLGAFIVVIAAVRVVAFLDDGNGIAGVLIFAGNALGGVMFVLAGLGRTVDVGTRTLARPHFLGSACLLLGASFAPFAADALSGSTASRAWGIAAGLGAASLVWIGGCYLTGRIEPAT